MRVYYNEIDPFAAAWLRSLMSQGLIAQGDVDERSIRDVRPDDLAGYSRCHFFAGISGWEYALQLAGWPDDAEIWTGSCPCQPFSVAGKRGGTADDRHLWPDFWRLIAARRPAVVMGEQVGGSLGYGWLDGVRSDLEGGGYACEAVDIPACAVNAPHRRNRIYWIAEDVADSQKIRRERGGDARRGRNGPSDCDPLGHGIGAGLEVWHGQPGHDGSELAPAERASLLVNGPSERRGEGRPEPSVRSGRATTSGASVLGDGDQPNSGQGRQQRSGQLGGTGFNPWSRHGWIVGHDGKARRVPEPGIRLLAHGVPNRVGALRGFGNAIVPELAAEVVTAYLETRGA